MVTGLVHSALLPGLAAEGDAHVHPNAGDILIKKMFILCRVLKLLPDLTALDVPFRCVAEDPVSRLRSAPPCAGVVDVRTKAEWT